MDIQHLSGLDLGVIAVYLVFVIAVGYWASRRVETGDDLFLAGRRLAWPVIGLSLFASNISSTTLVGVTGDSYRYGLAVSAFEWGTSFIMLVLVFVLIPFYLGSKLSTVPQFLENRFGVSARRYQSAATIVSTLLVDTAGPIYGGGLVLQMFFPGIDLWVFCVALALIAGVYTIAGGLAAVVYTDAAQTIILVLGMATLTVLVFGEFDYSWSQMVDRVQASDGYGQHFSVILPADHPDLPWTGLPGVFLLGLYYWTMNQYIVQRVLGAKNIAQAQWGAMLAGFLKLTPIFFMALPGVMALAIYPDLTDADEVFPKLLTDFLPTGLLGLVLAGFIAAIMSSIDSTLNSASTLVIVDFAEPMKDGELTEKQATWWGRISTVVFMCIAAAWAPVIDQLGSFFQYVQAALSYIVPPFIVLFMMGIFSHLGRTRTAIGTLIVTHAVAVVMFLLFTAPFGTGEEGEDGGGAPLYDLQYLYIAPILCAVALAAFFAFGLTEPRHDDERLKGRTWKSRERPDREKLSWYADHRIQALVLLALTITLIIVFF